MRTLTHPGRRRGISLTEALIAMFIMAIGLISLLALFPVAALQMAKAFKDERSAQLAANADYLARIIWKTAWINRTAVPERLNDEASEVFYDPVKNPSGEPFIQALDQPSGATAVSAAASTPSWPVFVDPIGFNLNTGTNQSWVAGLTNFVPRQNFGTRFLPTGSVASRIRLTTMTDDISFAPSGSGVSSATGQVERADRYNCAWLFQRLRNSARTDVNLHVVVYQNRTPTDIAAREQSFSVVGGNVSPGTTSVTINTGGVRPLLRTGGWILLAGQYTSGGTSSVTVNVAEFARVVAITEPATNQLQFELQTPTRNLFTYPGTVIVLDGVAEVFDRGTISATAPTAP